MVANQQHQDAGKNDAAHNNQSQNQNQNQDQQAQQHNPHTQSTSDITKPNADGITQQHTGVDHLLAQALSMDSTAAPTHQSSQAEQHVNVMVISTTLDNADAVASIVDTNTIVVKYDSHNTTSAQLLQQINDSLHGKKADSIAFMSEAGDGQLSLFKDGKTTITSLNDSVQQQFWHGVEGMLDSNGRVDFLASKLAATNAGKALVNEIAHITGHETAASTDLTGSTAKGGDWNLEYIAGGKNAHQVDLTETYLNRNILDSFTSVIPADTIQHEVAFINSTVKDAATIIKQLGENVDVVMLDSTNAFEEIQAYLNTHSNVDSVHIFTHGNDGSFKIGQTDVDNNYIDANKNVFAAWEKSLTKNADIMIYGCDVAESAAGKTLINKLATITGADVAASIDTTGRDGNWTLEYHAGIIDTSEFLIAGYNYNLANITLTVKSLLDKDVNQPIDPATLTLREAIFEANNDQANVYTINFADQATLKTNTPLSDGRTITMNSVLGEYVLKNNITINASIFVTGTTYTWAIIDAGGTMRHFSVNAGFNTALDSMELVNGHAPNSGGSPNDGGSIYNAGTLQINDVNMYNNHADNAGGAIFNTGNLTITVDDTNTAFHQWSPLQGWSIHDNTAGSAGGAIYNAKEGSLTIEGSGINRQVTFDSNSTASGSGGAIYTFGTIALTNVDFTSNTANGGDGGAIFISNLGSPTDEAKVYTHFFGVSMDQNHADGSGGGIYFTLGGNLLVEWSFINDNSAGGFGGGVFFDQSGSLTLTTDYSGSSIIVQKNTPSEFYLNTAGKSGGAIYMNNSGSLNVDFVRFAGNIAGNTAFGGSGGAIYANNTDNVTLTDVEISNNTATAGTTDPGDGGGIYYVNTNPGGTLNITSSGISSNTATDGAGIYFTAVSGATLNIVSSTLAYNQAADNGGAVWMDNGSLNITFGTLAYNMAAADGAAIYLSNTSGTASDISLLNTIVYNLDSLYTPNSQIYLGTGVSVTESEYNIYSHLYTDIIVEPGQSLTDGELNPVTRTLPNGTDLIVAYRDGLNNFVGYADAIDPVDGKTSSQKIQAYLYLDTTLNFAANYRTRTLSLLYKESFAYGGFTYKDKDNNSVHGGGLTVDSVIYDQRGNLRNGFDVNGNVNANPSIGAFEPIFYLTVTGKGDHTSLNFTNDRNNYGKYLTQAMLSDLTLREAVYWLDTYNPDPSVLQPLNILTDTDRYVKFSETVFTKGSSTINLTQGQIRIGGTIMGIADTSKQIRISITPDAVWQADNTYVAQNAQDRITIDAGGNSRIFTVTNTSIAIISNLTLQNGKASNTTDTMIAVDGVPGWGGAIYNNATTTLNNVVVQNSITSNVLTPSGYADASRGGGIYNESVDLGSGSRSAGTMTISDSTISGNQSISNADTLHPGKNLGLGGGIYNDGTMFIQRSTITGNSVSGNVSLVDNSVKGGGIYNASGSLTIVNTTISANTTNSSEGLKLDPATGVAAGAGSAIFVASGDLTVYYSTIVYNQELLNSAVAVPLPTSSDPKSIPSYYAAISMTGSGTFTLSYTIMGQNSARANSSPTYLTPWDIFTFSTATVDTTGNYNARYNIIPYFNGPADPSSPGFDWAQFNTPGQTLNYTGTAANTNVLDFLSSTLAYNGGKTMNYRIYDGSFALTLGSTTDHPDFADPLFATDQRDNSRSQIDRLNVSRPTIGAYEALTEVYVTSSGDTGATPAIQGFDFENDRPGFEADTVTVRDAFYWADPEAKIQIRYVDKVPSNWTTDKIILEYGQIMVSKGVDFYGDINFYNNVTSVSGIPGDPGQKVLTDPASPNRYSYYLGDTGETVYYDNNRAQYYYTSPTGTQVWLAATVVAPSDVTTTQVTYTDAQGVSHVKYVLYTDNTNNAQVFQNVIDGNFYYLSDPTATKPLIPIARVGTVMAFTTTDFYANTINTGRDVTVSASKEAGKESRVFNVDNKLTANVVSVAFKDMTISDGNAVAALGGGIYSFETLTLDNVNLMDNTAGSFGGGIYIQAGDLTILNSTVSGNSSSSDGGGVFSTGGKINIDTSSFLHNTAGGVGGGMFVAAASKPHPDIASVDFNIQNSTFGYNIAGTHGGGIYSDSSYLAVLNSTFSQNEAGQNGGGIAFTGGGELYLAYATIANNKCGTSLGILHFGGGVYITAGNMTVIDSILANNITVLSATTTQYNDFYATGGVINSATYSAVGAFVGFDFFGNNNIVGDNDGIIQGLGLSTILESNGGPALTLYLSQSSVAGEAGTVFTYTDYTGATVTVTTSENGVMRKSPSAPDSYNRTAPSMGAYESRISRYVYLGGLINDTDVTAWGFQDFNGNVNPLLNPRDFNILDATFVFNGTAVGTLSTTWDINSRSNIEVSGTFPFNGSFTIDASGQIKSTRLNETVTINVLEDGMLTLATNVPGDIVLGTVGDFTTVTYSYAGDQTILQAASYGYLELLGGGTKQYAGDLNVMSSLTLDGVILDIGGGLTVLGGGISINPSTIRLTGDLSLSGAPDFSTTSLEFVGTQAAQNVFLDSDQIFAAITVDNFNGVIMDSVSTSSVIATDFTFVNGAFTIYDGSLVLTNAPTGADGAAGRYFVTAGAGSVDLPLSADGTHFILAVGDAANPGEYKWTDVILSQGTATHAAMRLIDGVVPDSNGDPVDSSGSLTVTWDVTNADGNFVFALTNFSANAAGKYFDVALSQLHYMIDPSSTWATVNWADPQDAGYFYVGHDFLLVTNNEDSGTGSLRDAIDAVNISHAGVIVFDNASFSTDANVDLSSGLTILDGVHVKIVGLTDPGRLTYVRGYDFVTLTIGSSAPATISTVNLSYLDFRGGGTSTNYVLINNADLQVTNVSVGANTEPAPNQPQVPVTWQVAPIQNNGTLTVRNGSENTGYIALDGGAEGNPFIYARDSISSSVTLRYFGNSLRPSSDTGAEFSSSVWDVELVQSATGVGADITITNTSTDTVGRNLSVDDLSQLTINTDLTVNGDVTATGGVSLGAGNTLTLKGASNTLGAFNAGSGSTVNYAADIAQTVDAVTYSNLTISGLGEKTATGDFTVGQNLVIDPGSQLTLDYAASDTTLHVIGDTDVNGTLKFTGAGTLALEGDNNNLGNFIYGQSTVQYLGGSDQKISNVNYYNLEIGGGLPGSEVTKQPVDFNLTVINDFTIDAYTTFQLAANTMLVKGNFSMDSTGGFTFTDNGTLRLDGNVFATFSFDTKGTVVYQGSATQELAGGTYFNLDIDNGDKVLANDVIVNGNFTFDSAAGRLLISTNSITLNGLVAGDGAGRYFANTTTVNPGQVFFSLLPNQEFTLTVGTLTEWSTLLFTGSSMPQIISIWAKDGINPGVPNPQYAADMTFAVATNTTTSYSMAMLATSAGGSAFKPILAQPYYFDGSEWVMLSNPLTVSGDFFFGNGIPAGGFVVVNAKDSGIGSLRWAIEASNLTAGTNLITFDKDFFSQNRTISLKSELTITDSVVIRGLGTDLIIVDGRGLNRVFNVNDGQQSTISAYISGMTIRNGYASVAGSDGGAITNSEILRLENVEISGSTTNGGHGGGIYNALTGTLYTLNVTVAQNIGEGIYNDGKMSLFNTTVAFNTSGNGQIYTRTGTGSELFNVTVFTAGGGLAITNADTSAAGKLALNATLVYGTLNDSSYFTQNKSLVTSDSTIFVNGGELSDNGGWVRTIAINNSASVVNKGLDYKDGAYNNDARGYLINGTHDIGAFEYNGYVARNTTTGNYYSSVQAAVNAATGGNTIDLVDTRITTGAGSLVIDKNIIIEGSGAWSTVLAADGNLNTSVIVVGSAHAPAVSLYNFGIRGGHASGNGGAITNNGNLQLREMAVLNNTAVNGGAIYVSAAAFLSLDRSTVSGNSATGSGGAVYNLGTSYSVDSTIANNTADVNGGGGYNGTAGIFRLSRSTINNNTADVNGGGIYSLGSFFGENSTVYGNIAMTGNGGGIYVGGGTATSTNMTIAYNIADSATGSGGGVYVVSGSSYTAINTIIAYNSVLGGEWNDLYAATGAVINISTSNDLIGYYNRVSGDYSFNYGVDSDLFNGGLADHGGWTRTLALTNVDRLLSGWTLYAVDEYAAQNDGIDSKPVSVYLVMDSSTYNLTEGTLGSLSALQWAWDSATSRVVIGLPFDPGTWSNVTIRAGYGSNKAINGGDSSLSSASDQRGYLTNGIRDIGAYEYNGYVGWYTVTYSTGTSQYYVSSIQEGLDDIRRLAPKYNNLTLNLVNTRILENGITINLCTYDSTAKAYVPVVINVAGSASGDTVISGGGADRIFYLTSNEIAGGTLSLSRLTLADGSALVKQAPNVISNASDGFGGVAYVFGAVLNMNNVSVINSYSDLYGGAIYSVDNPNGGTGTTPVDIVGKVDIQNSFLGWNFSSFSGGAIASFGTSVLTVNDSTFYANTSGGNGGAVALFGKGAYTMTSDTLAYNQAITPSGGGIYVGSQDGSGTLTSGNNLLAHNYQTLNPDRYADVVTHVITGTGVPPDTFGNDGDTYINVFADTAGKIGDMYSKTAGVWTLVSNLIDSYHITYYTGTGFPADTIGQKGDIYVDTSTGDFYVRNANGTGGWGDPADPAPFERLGTSITAGSSANGQIFPPGTASLGAYCIDTFTGVVYQGQLDMGTGIAVWVKQSALSNSTTPTHIYSGTDAPGNIPGDVNGDYYVNTATGEFYVLIDGGWNVTNTISGSGTSNKVGMDYYLFSGKLTDSGYNLVESQNGVWNKDTSPNFFGSWTAKTATAAEVWSHDLVTAGPGPHLVTSSDMGNLFLTGKAQDNGGWGYTLALKDTSIAVNAGTVRTADQRGYLNFQAADIGAYEVNGIVAQIGSNSYSSIQAAVNAASSGDTITLIGSRIRENDIQSSTSLTITGVDGTVLDADRVGRIIMAKSSAVTTTINGVILTGGMALDSSLNTIPNAAGNGGAIFNNGTLTLTDVQVFDSFAQRSGGGVYSSLSLTINTGSRNAMDYATVFAGNEAGVSGGAVAALGTMNVKGIRMNVRTYGDNYDRLYFMVQFVDNTAWSNGGAVVLQGSSSMQYFYMTDNSSGTGGALMLSGTSGSSTLQDFIIANNNAYIAGGGIYAANYGDLNIIGHDNPDYIYNASHFRTSVSLNYSLGGGGGIYFTNSGNLTITGIEGDIYSGVLVESSKAFGDGGGIYFVNSNNLQLGHYIYVESNTAGGSGGGIYFQNGNQLALLFNCYVSNNSAGENGGGIYMQNAQMLSTNSASYIENNNAGYNYDSGDYSNARGGGLYLDNVQTVSLNYTTISDNKAKYVELGQNHGAGIYMYNCATVNLTDVEVHNSYYAEGIYIDSDSTVTPVVTIKTSSVNNSGSTGIYMTKGTLSLENVTVAQNGYFFDNSGDFHSAQVGGIYLAQGTLSINFCTLVNNYGSSAATLQMGSDAPGAPVSKLSIKNSIVDGYFDGVNHDIILANVSMASGASSYNILANYYNYVNASWLAGSNKGDIYNKDDNGIIVVAGAIDGNHNIVGYDSSYAYAISTHLYLDSLQYQANYRTRTYALLSSASIAYGYYTGVKNGVGTGFTRTGQADPNVGYDQRGNLRTGITISLDKNGQTIYTYYQYDTTAKTWQQVVVDESGKKTVTNGVTPPAPSVGAFEPLFYMTVTSKADDSGRMFNVVYSDPNVANTRFDAALLNGGINLREATYWIDSYNPDDVSLSMVDVNRYVKFSGTVFTAGGDNTIHLVSGDIILKKDILISITPEAWNNYTVDTVAYLAQDNASRITVSGDGASRIFRTSEDLNQVTAVISNLTLINGKAYGVLTAYDAGTGGAGGAIYNAGTLTLNNILIKNSEANADGIIGGSYAGLGGAIYNSTGAVLTINDSTLTSNLAVIHTHYDGANYDALGGALYNDGGTVTINRSLINNNTAQGFAYDPDLGGTALGLGGAIYNASGTITLTNNTITGNTLNGTSSSSGAAIYIAGGNLYAYNNTIVRNTVPADVAPGEKIPDSLTNRGSAVYITGSGSITLVNNIIAQNQITGSFQQYHDVYTENSVKNNITANNNIVGNFRGAYTFLETAPYNNIIGDTSGNVTNLNLSNTLAYLGGKTMSFRVDAGSVAIGSGTESGAPADDQRAATDLYWDHRTTIGSYELITKVTVTTTADPIAVTSDVKYDFTKNQYGWLASLRAAAFLADAGTVTIHPAVYSGDVSPTTVVDGKVVGDVYSTGNYYLNTADGKLYQKTSTGAWVLIETLISAKTQTVYSGKTAPQGIDGKNGDVYVTVADGSINTTGGDVYNNVSGTWVLSTNVIGSTAVYAGSGVPSGSAYNVGNYYVNTVDGKLYQKSNPVTWVVVETLTSAKTQTVYSGTGVPQASIGKNGDIYVTVADADSHTSGGTLYNKVSGKWVLSASGIGSTSGTASSVNLVYGAIRIGTGITITTAAGISPITVDGSNSDRVFMIDSFSTALVDVTLRDLTLQNAYAGTLKNDYYIDVSTGNLYLRSQTGWIQVGNVGVTGSLAQGVGAPTSATTVSGSNYVDVSTGKIYTFDTTANKWSQVNSSLTIEQTYNSNVYAGSGAPVSGADKSGDYYVNTDDGKLYQRDFAGNWNLIETLVSVNTQKVYSGTTSPSVAEKSLPKGTFWNNGDIYVMTADATGRTPTSGGDVYQKVGGQWVLSENVIGSTGDQHILNGTGAPSGLGSGQGGAVFSNENVRLSGVTVRTSMAATDGGGVYVTGATLALDRGTTIYDNTAMGNGGGIFINAGTLNATGDIVAGNYRFIEISNNTAMVGGGIYGNNSVINLGQKMVWDGTGTSPAIVVGADIHDNTASFGGGVGLVGSQLNMYFSTVDSNAATSGDGGGLYLNNAAVNDIENSTISNNTASRYGGGIYGSVQELDLVNSTVSGNSAGSYGGGVYFIGTDSLSLVYTTIANNQSLASGVSNGAGVYQFTGKLNMIDSIIAQNYSLYNQVLSRDDYYANNRVSAGAITYSIIGANNKPDFFADPSVHQLGDPNNPYSALGLSTTLENNGGPTQTLWISNTSLAIGQGVVVSGIVIDQRGIIRSTGTLPDGPTIGAYEKSFQHIYFNASISDDVTKTYNWTWSGSAQGFDIADAIYTIGQSALSLDGQVLAGTTWTVGTKSSVEVNFNNKLTVNSGATFVVQDVVVKDSAFMVIAGIVTSATTQNTSLAVSGNGTLDIATADSSISNVSIALQPVNNTTVRYSYNGNQTVRSLDYYNLELAGGGIKTSAAILTVGNNLSIDNSTLNLSAKSGGDLVASNVNLNSGAITGGGNDVTINGSLTAAGGSITSKNISLSGSANLAVSTLTASGNLNLFSAAAELDTSVINAGTFTATGSTITTVNTGIGDGVSTINSGSVTIDFAAGVNVVTVNDNSTLVFNTQNQNVLLDNLAGNTANHFMISDLNVHPAGVIEFSTSGTVTAQNIALGDDAGIQGTMWLSGAKQVIFDNTIFDNAYLVANGPVTLNADTQTSHSFQIRHDIKFIKAVTLDGAAGSTVTVISTEGSITFGSTVTSKPGGQNFIIDAFNNASVNNIANINDLDIYAANGSIQPAGTITAAGTVMMHNQVTVAAGANASITAESMYFNNGIYGDGRLNLSSQTDVALNQVNMGSGSFLNLAAGNYNTNDNDMTAGSLTVGKLASLVYRTMNLYGNLTVAGGLSTGSLNLLDGSGTRQVLSLTGTQSFIDVDLRNAAGAQLSSGNMTVFGDFKFTDGKFALNNNTVQLWAGVVNAGFDHYFVTNGTGFLRQHVDTGVQTDFWVGSEQYVSEVSITGNSGATWFAVSCMNKVTGLGTPSSPTIFGNENTVKYTWIIRPDAATNYQLALAWDPAGQGTGFASLDNANVFNYKGQWSSIQSAVPIDKSGVMHSINEFTTNSSGSFTVAAPNTDFHFPGEFRGLNDDNANSSGFNYPSIAVNVPPSQGEYSFDMMQLRLSESPLGNPLDVSIPATGTDMGGDVANDFLTVTTGESVYGSPNGENGVNTEWMPQEEREINPVSDEIDRQLDDFFTELADGSKHEKHPAFKSEIEIMLDKLLAS